MFDINAIVNEQIMRERILARSELANEILHIIAMSESPSDCIDKIQEVQEKLYEVKKEYRKFQNGMSL